MAGYATAHAGVTFWRMAKLSAWFTFRVRGKTERFRFFSRDTPLDFWFIVVSHCAPPRSWSGFAEGLNALRVPVLTPD